MKNRKQTVSNQVNILFVLTSVFIALCLFVPVWQSSVSGNLSSVLAKEERTVSSMEEQKMVLTASVENKRSPEYVENAAFAQNIELSQITRQEANAVASSL